jgi:tellurite resistance protein TerA
MVIDGIQFSHDRGGDKNEVTNQGCYTESPWIWHSGDEKIGEGDGESILINPKGIPDIERIMVYCFIYEGAAKWNETNAVATIKVSNHPDIIVEMGQQSNSETFCALVEILIDTNQEITVKKLVSFHEGHEDCDSFYNWGMTWTEGDK